MKYILFVLSFLGVFLAGGQGVAVYGQQATVVAKNAMNTGIRNYQTFTAPYKNTAPEAAQANAAFSAHPEAGLLFAETPCDNCYELISERTETGKTFVKLGTNGKSIARQTSDKPMHYRNDKGEWLTVKAQLRPTGDGRYAAPEQECPTLIDAHNRFAQLGADGTGIKYNNDLRLIYERADGVQSDLGAADWTNYTAGDDGVYVTNAWPGIDIEMYAFRGAIKTNFIINRALPAYAGGRLLVRDHVQLPAGYSLYAQGKTTYTGNMEVRNADGKKIYDMSAATAFEKADIKRSLKMLEYRIAGNELDIALPGDFLNRPSAAYPVIIDPLVSNATISSVSGSTYSSGWTVGCVYTNAATVPARVTITDVQFSFQYVTSGGALLNNGAFDFRLGTCRSPTPTLLWWNCNSLLTGTCTGTGASIYSSLFPCVPPPQCAPYDMGITMNFYQNYLADAPCSNAYISAGSPLTITVFGNTIEPTAVITSDSTICQGQSATLSTTAHNGVAPYTYTWMPGGLTGTPVTVSPTVTTTYTVVATDLCGETAAGTRIINVSPYAPITGVTSVCVGGTTTLGNTLTGGTWQSLNPSVALISPSTGIVIAVAPGTSAIRYTTPGGCVVSATVTVLPLPSAIGGPSAVCQGKTITLTDATGGGTWSSRLPAIGSIDAGGVVTGVLSGSTIITYTLATGCYAVHAVTVTPVAAISGSSTVCVGGSLALSNTVPGGTWSSGATSIAPVNPTTGVVSGIAAGTAVITYTTPAGCIATKNIAVTLLTAIAGAGTVCQGSATTLTNPTSGGSWISVSPGVAVVGSGTGIVTGVSAGTTIISYITPGGCYATTTMLVYPLAPITGPSAVCEGSDITLTDATAGGSWSSLTPALASVGSLSGIVTGIASGVATIAYTTADGCVATAIVNVNPVNLVTGALVICQGGFTSLTNATPGGTWTSGNTAIATVGSLSGIVSGVGAGTVAITYTNPYGCIAAATVTVNPISPIAGALSACIGDGSILTNATPGGTWSSANPAIADIGSISGAVSALTAGTSAIRYTTGAGCFATATFTVHPISPITGPTALCFFTTLANVTPGGSWVSSNLLVATVGFSTGVVTGVSAGTSVITYTTARGCTAFTTVTVTPLLPIAGTPNVCVGSITSLTNTTPGGVWSSSNPTIAGIGSTTGDVSGVAAGTAIITYTTPIGCITTVTVTVHPLSPIVGPSTVCQGRTIILSDPAAGGSWLSSSPAVATIGSLSGVVTGVSSGTTVITYTTSAGCTISTTLTVYPLAPIVGATSLCAGQTTTLSDATPGGLWTSSSPAVAAIDGTAGTVSAVAAGTATISYTTPAGCIATSGFIVHPVPSAIGGITSVCVGSFTNLTNTLGGGIWVSRNTAVATIGITSGIAGGVSADTTTISYTTTGGCSVAVLLIVHPLPAAIAGVANLCVGSSATFTNATPVGTWSSSAPAVAAVGSLTGVVSGIAAGTTIISFTTPNGCYTTQPLTIHVLPAAITGVTTICAFSSTTLSNTLAGGSWSSSAPAIADIDAVSGLMSGVSVGTAIITYSTTFGCFVTTSVRVNPTPVITSTPATNPTTCTTADGYIGLTGLTPGETYTVHYYSGSTPITVTLTADGSGTVIVTGLAPGSYSNFSVTNSFGCTSVGIEGPIVITKPAPPTPPTASNNDPVCDGGSLELYATHTLPDVSYNWSGPLGFTSTQQNPVISPAYLIHSGVYSVTATRLACESAPVTTTVVIHPIPNIGGVTATNPTTCKGTDGTMTLTGLTPGLTFVVRYLYNSAAVTTTVVADVAGKVLLTGLAAGAYAGITVQSFTCVSNVVGPVSLVDPGPPATPQLWNNGPMCAGKTLLLKSKDDDLGYVYEWTGPNGFVSNQKEPVIDPTTIADSGLYTLTIRYRNCPSSATMDVVIYPPVKLEHVTPSQTIPIGSKIQLYASGATYYLWTPNGGTLNDAAIDSPIANTEETITYMVKGRSEFGCVDSAYVTVTIDYNIEIFIPNAFTPNNDGNNDEFRIGNLKYDRLVDFTIYNRWGEEVYHNNYNVKRGWDGTMFGVPQDMGVYHYSITLGTPDGRLKFYKGDVTLIR